MGRFCAVGIVFFLVALTGATSVLAQNNRFTERSFVPSPSVQSMGDAGVALSGRDRSFFYNPAHLPNVASQFTITGVQASASPRFDNFVHFMNDRVAPAIETGFDRGTEAHTALYREASTFTRRPARGHGAVVLPSFVYSTSGLGVGGGLFAKTALNYRVDEAGGSPPELFLLSRTDVMALASIGVDLGGLGLSGLSMGVTGGRTQRFLAFKNKPIDQFSSEEAPVLLSGETIQMDVGMQYTPSWWILPGTPVLGGAVYDVLDQEYDYSPGGTPDRLPFLKGIASGAEADEEPDPAEVAEAQAQFDLERSYRVGVAYRLSSLLFLEDVRLAVDYQGYERGPSAQQPLARLHAGGEARLVGPLVVRGGVGAGYPSGGLGLHLGPLQLDYAFHGYEEGRRQGQLATYVHTARLTLRIR